MQTALSIDEITLSATKTAINSKVTLTVKVIEYETEYLDTYYSGEIYVGEVE